MTLPELPEPFGLLAYELNGYTADQMHAYARAALAQTGAEPAPDVEALAHRMAWRYKKSADPAHSDTYTFNRSTLLQFAEALQTATGGASLAQTGAEPVAWAVYAIVDGQWSMQWPLSETREFAEVHAGMYGVSYTVEVRPLYAATTAQPAPPPAREPLSADAVLDLAECMRPLLNTREDWRLAVEFGRSIEAAHNITATPAAKEQP